MLGHGGRLREADILLIEDDDVEARGVMRGFRKARISNRITRAKDGIEALELLRSSLSFGVLGQYPILLVDLNMPRMNGIEFLTALRADDDLARHIAFVLSTSQADKDVCAAYDLNIAGYVVKSEAGENFRHLVTLLEDFWTTVQMPVPG